MEIAIKVEVDVFHWDDLRIATARSTALHTKHRTQRGLTQADDCVFTDVTERIPQAHRGGGLALSRGCGTDGCHQDHPSGIANRLLEQPVETHFAFDSTVRFEGFIGDR